MSDTVHAPTGRARVRLPAGWPWLAAVGLLFCLPLFVGLGRGDMQNDEAIYSFASDVMVATGDWLTPRSSPSEDEPFLEKPPLKFWIVAAPIRLGLLPDNEFGLRFWDALFGGIAFLYLFLIGRRLGGPVAGIGAALVLFVHRPLLVEHGLRSNNMEAALVLAYCGGMYHASTWRVSGDGWRGRGHVLAIGLYFVLAFMTKFVAALFLPLVIGAALLARSEDRRRAVRWWRSWLATAGVAAGLIVPWFLYQYHRFGQRFVEDMFGDSVYARFTSYLNPEHVQPWHFYFTAAWAELAASGAAVWVAAGLMLVLWRTIRTGWPDGAMVLLWFGLPFAAISFGTSKLYHYAYPFLPALALAAGYAASVAWHVLNVALPRLEDRVGRLLGGAGERVMNMPAVRVALGIVAALGCAAAVATIALGSVKLAVGGLTLFKASAPGRALALVVLALLLARRARSARVVVATLAIAAALPIGAYRNELSMLPAERHRLRSIRDCLGRVGHANPTPGNRAPVYVDGANISHPAAFYLRTLGNWKLEEPSNAEIFSSLYVDRRPVLLGPPRYAAFEQWMIDRQDAGASLDGIDPGKGAAGGVSGYPIVRLHQELLILPGPYGACAF